MKKYLGTIIAGIIVIALAVLGWVFGGPKLNEVQLDTLLLLCYVCLGCIAYCFIVGEISRNNSQMDKIWSIAPIAYTWIVAAKSGMNPRIVVIAALVTVWGIRLTSNFARKGAYSIKFWAGEEDYRWVILRNSKAFQNKFLWALFDLLFISFFQNAVVLGICLPTVALMSSEVPFGLWDGIIATVAACVLLYETIADEQQMQFHTIKRALLKEGKKLEELPLPYARGFNTTGLWGYSRHPNYLAEQSFWVVIYLFVISAGVASMGVFDWTISGAMVLIIVFLGSSIMAEQISSKKYPEYAYYCATVSKYLPGKKYVPEAKK